VHNLNIKLIEFDRQLNVLRRENERKDKLLEIRKETIDKMFSKKERKLSK
jgi:hypothetical protein